jgi:hypothetical protein
VATWAVRLYRPAAQAEQVATAEVDDQRPSGHIVQVLAPGFGPEFVFDPDGHMMQKAASEACENIPTVHGEHDAGLLFADAPK